MGRANRERWHDLSPEEKRQRTAAMHAAPKPPRAGRAIRRSKGGRMIHRGYVYVYVGQGRYVAEHRLIAAAALRRPLRRGEVVHHVDGNGFNNSPGNLVITSAAFHRSLEHRLAWRLDPEKVRRDCAKGGRKGGVASGVARRKKRISASVATPLPPDR
jgi:HNH endonuclease